jgi:hypothetical protein
MRSRMPYRAFQFLKHMQSAINHAATHKGGTLFTIVKTLFYRAGNKNYNANGQTPHAF